MKKEKEQPKVTKTYKSLNNDTAILLKQFSLLRKEIKELKNILEESILRQAIK